MTIRKCPHCLQHNHFDVAAGFAPCWKCKAWSDFAQIRTFGQRVTRNADAALSAHLPDALESRWAYYAKFGLLAALPVVVFMLMICNSLDIHIVKHLAESFHSLPINDFASHIIFD